MSRDKEIEELTQVIWRNTGMYDEELTADVALVVHDAGYRKVSDVAREIFEEIDKLVYRLLNDVHYIAGDLVWDINELKKKYESEGADDGNG